MVRVEQKGTYGVEQKEHEGVESFNGIDVTPSASGRTLRRSSISSEGTTLNASLIERKIEFCDTLISIAQSVKNVETEEERKGLIEQAKQHLEDGHSETLELSDVWFYLGVVFLHATENIDEAYLFFREATKLNLKAEVLSDCDIWAKGYDYLLKDLVERNEKRGLYLLLELGKKIDLDCDDSTHQRILAARLLQIIEAMGQTKDFTKERLLEWLGEIYPDTRGEKDKLLSFATQSFLSMDCDPKEIIEILLTLHKIGNGEQCWIRLAMNLAKFNRFDLMDAYLLRGDSKENGGTRFLVRVCLEHGSDQSEARTKAVELLQQRYGELEEEQLWRMDTCDSFKICGEQSVYYAFKSFELITKNPTHRQLAAFLIGKLDESCFPDSKIKMMYYCARWEMFQETEAESWQWVYEAFKQRGMETCADRCIELSTEESESVIGTICRNAFLSKRRDFHECSKKETWLKLLFDYVEKHERAENVSDYIKYCWQELELSNAFGFDELVLAVQIIRIINEKEGSDDCVDSIFEKYKNSKFTEDKYPCISADSEEVTQWNQMIVLLISILREAMFIRDIMPTQGLLSFIKRYFEDERTNTAEYGFVFAEEAMWCFFMAERDTSVGENMKALAVHCIKQPKECMGDRNARVRICLEAGLPHAAFLEFTHGKRGKQRKSVSEAWRRLMQESIALLEDGVTLRTVCNCCYWLFPGREERELWAIVAGEILASKLADDVKRNQALACLRKAFSEYEGIKDALSLWGLGIIFHVYDEKYHDFDKASLFLKEVKETENQKFDEKNTLLELMIFLFQTEKAFEKHREGIEKLGIKINPERTMKKWTEKYFQLEEDGKPSDAQVGEVIQWCLSSKNETIKVSFCKHFFKFQDVGLWSDLCRRKNLVTKLSNEVCDVCFREAFKDLADRVHAALDAKRMKLAYAYCKEAHPGVTEDKVIWEKLGELLVEKKMLDEAFNCFSKSLPKKASKEERYLLMIGHLLLKHRVPETQEYLKPLGIEYNEGRIKEISGTLLEKYLMDDGSNNLSALVRAAFNVKKEE